MTQWSRVRALADALSSNNFGQVVHTHVPLSPSSIIWYWPIGGETVRLGSKPQAWHKVMVAYRQVDDVKSPAG